MSGDQQTGFAEIGGIRRAGVWTGSAASWVDLNPAGSVESYAFAASPGRQFGYARIGNIRRAGSWSGSAATWIDLNPAGATESQVYGANHEFQVGYAVTRLKIRATLWSGSASSCVDLSQYLSPTFRNSLATSVTSDEANTYVSGYAFSPSTLSYQAVLWTRPNASGNGCDFIDFNNNDVFPEEQDVIDFISVFAGAACPQGSVCNDIDFNNNNVFPEDQDVIDFLHVLAGGSCS
jgi:hypothetical protein